MLSKPLTLLLACAATAVATASTADVYRASTGLKVTRLAADQYVVSGVPSFGPADYWCTIGEFSQRVLRLNPEARIYVVGRYQRGQRTYTFSTSPDATASRTERVLSTSIRVDGANKKANAARADCFARRAVQGR